MKDYRKMYVTICKQFIRDFFAEHCVENGGVYTEYFWEAAEKSGLWVRGTYASPMSDALAKLTESKTVSDENGKFKYNVFKLKQSNR